MPTTYEAIALAIGALAMGGVAYATIPHEGIISACYMKSGGTLRVIDATTGKCSSKETSLNWNVQGPAGPAGEDGEAGPPGAPGPAGISGYELITETDDFASPFDPDRRDVIVECPEGKKFLGGGWALYVTKPDFAPFYWAPERVQAMPQALPDGTHRYTVTTHLPTPATYTGQELRVSVACANVAA